jgi:exodeoxyribonuclease VII small subunit
LSVFQAHPRRTDKLARDFAAPTRTMSTTAPQTTPAPASFETALAELETIVATMESGQLPLAESLAAYKRGAELLQYCQTALKDAQQQVQILERGVLKSFEPDVAQAPGSDEVDEP